jgi:hypothetical protein
MIIISLTVFTAILAIVIAADQGQWQLWADNTPAHFIFVGLVQVRLRRWKPVWLEVSWRCMRVAIRRYRSTLRSYQHSSRVGISFNQLLISLCG